MPVQFRTRIAVLAATLAVAAMSTAQTAESKLRTSIDAIRSTGELALGLDGTRQVGSTTIPVVASLSIQLDISAGYPVWRFEAENFENGVRTHRIVGDGQFFITYDALKNTYTSIRYGTVDASGQLPDHLTRAFLALRRRSPAPVAFLAAMGSDVFERGGTRWAPYLSTGTRHDDLNNVIVRTNNPWWRETSYHLDLAGKWVGVTHREVNNGTVYKEDIWPVTVHAGTVFAGANFTFIPPPGSRSLGGESVGP
ncbi:MAG: hypothetical protein KF812_04335 [Fimbriimonadaceae bacterium]|nr:hypothetical protein [Fimbriimonadaceae bacterium]